MLQYILITLLQILAIVIPILISVAYLTLAERKVMGAIHRRRGPNVIGYLGFLQPLADGLKLFAKEAILPSNANLPVFIIAPAITFVFSLIGWAVIPFGEGAVISDVSAGMLYSLTVSSFGVYGILCSGWSSNSRYAFLGALRSAAQMISYEVSMGFILVTVTICAGSLNYTEIVFAQKGLWYIVPLFPTFVMFLISALAETNRHPFDLPEAESELVSGYNIEYSAMAFALFSLGEYSSIMLMSSITSILFLGGWLPPFNIFSLTLIPEYFWFSFKTALVIAFFIWMRALLPRYRYDHLMVLGWKIFLPLSIATLTFTSSILISFNLLPN